MGLRVTVKWFLACDLASEAFLLLFAYFSEKIVNKRTCLLAFCGNNVVTK